MGHQIGNFQVMCVHRQGASQGCYQVIETDIKGCVCSPLPHPHLFVIPLQHEELFLQGLILTLQVHSGQVHVVQHPLQSSDVCLHSHPHGQLILIPDGPNGFVNISVRHQVMLDVHVKFHLCGRCVWRMRSLGLEIVSCQFCVVNVQDCLCTESGGNTNLWKNKAN